MRYAMTQKRAKYDLILTDLFPNPTPLGYLALVCLSVVSLDQLTLAMSDALISW